MTTLLAVSLFGLNPFQLIVLPLLLIAAGVTLWQWLVHRKRRLALATLVFLAAMVGVADPALTQKAATAVGIGRGTDLVVYITAFALIGVTFFLLHVQRKLRMEITDLTRQLALRDLPATARPSAETTGHQPELA